VPVTRYALSGVIRGVRAFLNLEAGVVRSGDVSGRQAPLSGGSVNDGQGQEIERLHALLAAKDRELTALRTGKEAASTGGPRPENFVWIFGDGRTGSTWLMRMVEELEGQTLWREPMLGLLFGYLYYLWADEKRHKTKHFILGRHRESWIGSIRTFVLDEARARFPNLGNDEYLVVKEPNGSVGAPLLVEALPESRMILLVRDPRDVVASSMDAHKEGSWHYERRNLQESLADEKPEAFVEKRAYKYLWYMGNSKRAYDEHRGPKVMIRYEDLRSDTLGTLKHVYSSLDIPVDEEALSAAVRKHSWESVPEEDKGEGKFYRKASPGSWREDLAPAHIEIVERITAPLLREFYGYEGDGESLSEKLDSSRQWMRMLYGP
jgi:hypothetical protein